MTAAFAGRRVEGLYATDRNLLRAVDISKNYGGVTALAGVSFHKAACRFIAADHIDCIWQRNETFRLQKRLGNAG